MITLLTGDNNYALERALSQLVAAFDGEAEKYDGAELELRQMPDLLMGQSLFAEKRLIIIRDLASNKQVWDTLPEWLERMSDDIHLVLVEASPDKRTRAYKMLQKSADVKVFELLGERDSRQAERWIAQEAKRMGMQLDEAAAKALLERSFVLSAKGQPVVDQWQVMHSLEKLSVFDTVAAETVRQYIDDQPVDSVFGVFETALKGDSEALHQLLRDIEPKEDPFRVFGLLSGQVFQLVALSSSDQPASEVAKAIGVHPYAMSKLAPYAKKLSRRAARQIVAAFVEADEFMKSSRGEPWTLIEQALAKSIAAIKNSA